MLLTLLPQATEATEFSQLEKSANSKRKKVLLTLYLHEGTFQGMFASSHVRRECCKRIFN